MGRPVKGDVVSVLFPFSDLSGSKKRPALVIAALRGDDFILCQITSSSYGDPYSIPLQSSDFVNGSLHKESFIRPNKIFTAEYSIVDKIMGHLSPGKVNEVVTAIHGLLTQS